MEHLKNGLWVNVIVHVPSVSLKGPCSHPRPLGADSSTDSQLTLHTDFLRDHSMGPQTFGSRSTDERNSGTTDTGDLGSSGIVSNTGVWRHSF